MTTQDISGRVSSAIQAKQSVSDELTELRAEIRQLAQTTALLHEEILRLRMDLARHSPSRISRASAEQLVRLS